jgi:alkylated DNA repair dioxygenase AlkB
MVAGPLFDEGAPNGFHYRAGFVSPEEEAALLSGIRTIEFSNFEMRGVVARRRVALFGESYSGSLPSQPFLPSFLLPLISRIAAWAVLPPSRFAMALINEYPPGAPIGWHRDAPQHDLVAGVSLLSACRMKFRPYRLLSASTGPGGRRGATHETILQPRSAYLMTGDSRYAYEHHIPAVDGLRYSITFRTRREKR